MRFWFRSQLKNQVLPRSGEKQTYRGARQKAVLPVLVKPANSAPQALLPNQIGTPTWPNSLAIASVNSYDYTLYKR